MGDFIAEKGNFGGTDERLLHLQYYAKFGTSGNDSLELVGGIFVAVCQYQEIVEYDDRPFLEIFKVENVPDYGLEEARGWANSLG